MCAKFVFWLTALHAIGSLAFRLTNMTAPLVQDPRRQMELHCRFDMGGEQLYAVKWYKDDHEFFRYTPSLSEAITQYSVVGVSVETERTRCNPDSCDLVLKDLSRRHSSGAYRCEVSTEAPAFRLASQTHNVTVAALPNEKPKLEGVLDHYYLGDTLVAHCTAGPADPRPSLAWYINGNQIPTRVRELSSSNPLDSTDADLVNLKYSTTTLKLGIDKKYAQNRARAIMEIQCVASLDGINPAVVPPMVSTKNVTVLDQNLLVNNQKLHSPYNAGTRTMVTWAIFMWTLTIVTC